MSDWREGYRRAMLTYLACNGEVRDRGYNDSEATREFQEHMAVCEVDLASSGDPEEEEIDIGYWDSMNEGSQTMHGVSVTLSCVCHRFYTVSVRLHESVGSMILAMARGVG
jgi:hypothetical protein